VRTGAETKRRFNTSRAAAASEVHLKVTLTEVSAVRGATMRLKFLMNLL
jgi:hypothetical protein